MAGSIQDDIRRFQLEINTASKNGETLAQLTKLEKETSKLRNQNTELQKTMAHLATTGRKGTEEYKRFETQLKTNRKAIRQNADEMKGLQKNLDLNYMSMGQLKKRAGSLKSTLNSMSKAANPKQYDKLEKELGQVGTQMDKLRGKGKKTKGMFSGLMQGAKGLLPAFGWTALIAGAIAFGKKIFDLAKQTGEYRKQVKGLTSLTGPALVDLTAKLEATSNTFNQEFEKLAIANHNFAESMNISEEAANKLINKGFLDGADASGEFLDKLREYGPQFKAAGLSAEQSIALMTQEVKEGIYSDKGSDAIKEAMLALREMPKTAQEALAGIGISSKKMQDDLATGLISPFEAMQQVSRKMAELPPQSAAVGTAIADIFKGAGEDAGLDYILMLGEVGEGIDGVNDKTDKTREQQERLLKANQDLSQSWGELLGEGTGALNSWTITGKIFFKEGIVKIINGFKNLRVWFVDFYNKSALLRGIISGMGAGAKIQFQIWKTALLEVWEYLKGFGNTIKAIFTGDFRSIDDIWKNTFSNMKDIASDGAKKSGEAAVNAWNETVNGKMELPDPNTGSTDTSITNPTSTGKTTPTKSYERQVVEKVVDIKFEEFDMAELDAINDAIIIADADFERKRAEIRKEYNLMSLDEMETIELDRLALLHEQKLLSEEEYLQAKADLELGFDEIRREEDEKIKQEKINNTVDTLSAIQAISQTFSDIFAMIQDSELAAVQDKLDAGSISEKQAKEEELKIKKKYADKQFIAMAADIIATTAVSAMNSYSSMADIPYVGPALGVIAAGAATAAGVIQLDIANDERNRVKALYTGGYTGSGSKYEKAGGVQYHKDEYVIPSEGVNNPNIKPFISIMEQQRVAGRIGNMGMPMVTPRVGGYQPVNSGGQGYPIDNQPTPVNDNNTALTGAINDLVEKGVLAHYGDYESRQLKEQQDLDAKLKAQTSW